ncbi:MAG: hypothetical protein ACLGI6_06875 [Gammaproteobacteria bacterium]
MKNTINHITPKLGVLAVALALPLAALAQQPSQPPGKDAQGRERINFEPTYTKVERGAWKGKRTAGGQPDVEGHWSNTVANHSNWTDPQGNIPFDPNPPRRKLGARNERAPSRVTDPADGEVPFQPWAREAQQDFLKNFHNPTKPEYIEPLARCAPAGVPKSLIWHGYEIRQFPGYVVFLFNSGTRIIHLDNKPHLPANIKLWNADSRGHWEGNTLVVDVTNNNGKAMFGRTGEFASENVHITERYIFSNDGERFTYEADFDDPTVYTRKWTATIPNRRRTAGNAVDGWHYEVNYNQANGKEVIERYERICTENNIGFGNVAVTPRR